MSGAIAVPILGLMLAAGTGASAAETAAPAPIRVKDERTIEANIETIDHAHGTMTIVASKGKLVNLLAAPGVAHFEALKRGDKVLVTYYEWVAVDIQPSGTLHRDSAPSKGAKPAGNDEGTAPAYTISSLVTITAIDPTIPAATVRSSDGATRNLRILDKELLSKFTVGGQVAVTEAPAVMVSVEATN